MVSIPESEVHESRSGFPSTGHAVTQADPDWFAMGYDAAGTAIAGATMEIGHGFASPGMNCQRRQSVTGSASIGRQQSEESVPVTNCAGGEKH
jgi:hypothetical protein